MCDRFSLRMVLFGGIGLSIIVSAIIVNPDLLGNPIFWVLTFFVAVIGGECVYQRVK